VETDKPDYKDRWYQFLKRGKDCSFLVNPKPKFTSDTIIQGDKLNRLFEDNIIPAVSEFELGPNVLFSQGSKFTPH
jgi:hypothetical protein